mgnify:CR=1 FL=1
MMKLIQNIDIYAPQYLGKKDVLTSMIRLSRLKMQVLYPQKDFFLRQK